VPSSVIWLSVPVYSDLSAIYPQLPSDGRVKGQHRQMPTDESNLKIAEAIGTARLFVIMLFV